MMDILNLGRGKGKTTYLLMKSHMTQIPILTATIGSKDYVKIEAERMGLDIPEPLTVNDLAGDNARGRIKPSRLLVDEMPAVLQAALGITIDTATMTERDNI
ncbi:hypothetical protein K413DRAFT_4633 [Clostridium sp. ASBs410]|nr:hypothetical protein K413DRAFT_4633 [Clostridium sp. ASBs410]